MRVQRKGFGGGYRFRKFEGRPEPRLEEMKLPERVTVLLEDPLGTALVPAVKARDKVRAGQIIATGAEDGARPLPAPVGGTVEEIRDVDRAGRKVRAVVIASDGDPSWTPLSGHGPEWETKSAESLEGLIYASGLSMLGRQGFPTRLGGSSIEPGRVEHVIVQEAGSELYPACPEVLLEGGGADRLAEGLRIVGRVLPGAALHLALNRERRDLMERVSAALSARNAQDGLRWYALEPKYPQHREEVLVPTLLGRPVPPGGTALEMGVLILDFQAVIQLAEAVVDGKPVLERTIALAGPGFESNPHVRVRIGTPVQEAVGRYLRTDRAVRVVANSAVDGETFADLSLPIEARHTHLVALPEDEEGEPFFFARPGFRKDSYSRTFLSSLVPLTRSAETNLHGEPRPCISCSYCENVCPAGIMPQHLHRYAQRGIIDEKAVRYGIFRCIDCNLCTYVCPSKVPVARLIREGKARLAEEGLVPENVAKVSV